MQVLVDVEGESRAELYQLFGEYAFYATLDDVVNAYRQNTG